MIFHSQLFLESHSKFWDDIPNCFWKVIQNSIKKSMVPKHQPGDMITPSFLAKTGFQDVEKLRFTEVKGGGFQVMFLGL